MNDVGNYYTTLIPSLEQKIPYAPIQYSPMINGNYNYRVTALPNSMIGRRHNIPERQNDSGAYQPPGIPIWHLDKNTKHHMNVGGFVKPSYTPYG